MSEREKIEMIKLEEQKLLMRHHQRRQYFERQKEFIDEYKV